MFGYELGDRATRMARLAEALEVIDLLGRHEEAVSHSGRFYRLQEARLLPRSPRPRGPRILIGGAGPKRTLPLTARYADAWNTGGRSPDAFRESSTLLDELLVRAGRQPGDVRRTLMQQVICYRSEADLGQRLRHVAAPQPGATPAATLAALRERSPHIIAGHAGGGDRPDRGTYAAAGVEEIMVQRLDLDDIEGLQIIAEEVSPHVG